MMSFASIKDDPSEGANLPSAIVVVTSQLQQLKYIVCTQQSIHVVDVVRRKLTIYLATIGNPHKISL